MIAGVLLVMLLVPFYFFPDRINVSEEKQKEREERMKKAMAEDSMVCTRKFLFDFSDIWDCTT